MKLKISIVLLLVLVLDLNAALVPILPNFYTTNTEAAVDAHVQSIAGSGGANTNALTAAQQAILNWALTNALAGNHITILRTNGNYIIHAADQTNAILNRIGNNIFTDIVGLTTNQLSSAFFNWIASFETQAHATATFQPIGSYQAAAANLDKWAFYTTNQFAGIRGALTNGHLVLYNSTAGLFYDGGLPAAGGVADFGTYNTTNLIWIPLNADAVVPRNYLFSNHSNTFNGNSVIVYGEESANALVTIQADDVFYQDNYDLHADGYFVPYYWGAGQNDDFYFSGATNATEFNANTAPTILMKNGSGDRGGRGIVTNFNLIHSTIFKDSKGTLPASTNMALKTDGIGGGGLSEGQVNTLIGAATNGFGDDSKNLGGRLARDYFTTNNPVIIGTDNKIINSPKPFIGYGQNVSIINSSNTSFAVGENSLVGLSPNTVIGWAISMFVTNSQGVVVDYARPSTTDNSGNPAANPTYVKSDHSQLSYNIGSVFTNWNRSAVLWSENSIFDRTSFLSAGTFNFVGVAWESRMVDMLQDSVGVNYQSVIQNSTESSFGVLYRGNVTNANLSVVGAAENSDMSDLESVFIGVTRPDAESTEQAQIFNNIGTAILVVKGASGNHAAAIVGDVGSIIHGDAESAAGQLRITPQGNGRWQVRQYGDSFGAGGVFDFEFGAGGLYGSANNLTNSPVVPGTNNVISAKHAHLIIQTDPLPAANLTGTVPDANLLPTIPWSPTNTIVLIPEATGTNLAFGVTNFNTRKTTLFYTIIAQTNLLLAPFFTRNAEAQLTIQCSNTTTTVNVIIATNNLSLYGTNGVTQVGATWQFSILNGKEATIYMRTNNGFNSFTYGKARQGF